MDRVGPTVGQEIQQTAILAALLAMFGILVYVAFRYEFSFAVGAVVAIIHDILMTLGWYFLAGRELNATTVAAVLTIIGFSINDTIVIFDRIREDLKLGVRGTFREVMNKALNQTLSRTIITSGTVFLATLSLYIFGGGVDQRLRLHLPGRHSHRHLLEHLHRQRASSCGGTRDSGRRSARAQLTRRDGRACAPRDSRRAAMLALVEITGWHWVGFIACVLCFPGAGPGRISSPRPRRQIQGSAGLDRRLVLAWPCCSPWRSNRPRGRKEALEFLTGYLIELSLSMDNVFVIALIFAYFRIPSQYQHRVLFWGILGALIMRGVMIGAGRGHRSRGCTGCSTSSALLLIFSGIKMMFVGRRRASGKEPRHPARRGNFTRSPRNSTARNSSTRWNGRRALTPLALVLLMVETTDLIFALDSIPAIFAVTTKPFIVFTSNVFAILGLRSLYFVLAGAIAYFRYLKYGLSLVLVFIGVKMLLDPHDHTPRWFQMEIPTASRPVCRCRHHADLHCAFGHRRRGVKKVLNH